MAMVIGEDELIEDCEEKVAQVHDRPHEIPWNCIFLSDEDSADDLNIKDRLLFLIPRWFLDRNFDEIGEAKGETKLSLILDTGFSPLPLPRKTARNESDTREQRSKRSPSFDSTIFQFWKSNYLTIRHTAGGGYFIKTCNSIQKRGRR